MAVIPLLLSLHFFIADIVSCGAQSKSQTKTGSYCLAGENARKFYEEHLRSSADYTEASIRSKQKWFSAELFTLLILERQISSKKKDVPYIDGDPFTDSQEPPKRFRLGKSRCSSRKSHVKVDFAYDDSFSEGVVVHLKLQGNIWKIDNIYYKGGHDLRSDLKHK